MQNFCLPSLLDRLRDPRVKGQSTGPQDPRLNVRDYRATVVRDLQDLLNASPLPTAPGPRRGRVRPADRSERTALEAFPLVRQSVLNYGLEDLSGLRVTEEMLVDLAQGIRQAIKSFEPRLDDVRVRPIVESDSKTDQEKKDFVHKRQCGLLAFLIEGSLYAEPAPVPLRLRAELDTRTGHHSVGVSRGL